MNFYKSCIHFFFQLNSRKKKVKKNPQKANKNKTKKNIQHITDVRESLAKSILNISLRIYPQGWPDMFTDLFTHASNNPKSLRILFIILCDLIEASTEGFLGMSNQRKTQIRDGLAAVDELIIGCFNGTMQQCIDKFRVLFFFCVCFCFVFRVLSFFKKQKNKKNKKHKNKKIRNNKHRVITTMKNQRHIRY